MRRCGSPAPLCLNYTRSCVGSPRPRGPTRSTEGRLIQTNHVVPVYQLRGKIGGTVLTGEATYDRSARGLCCWRRYTAMPPLSKTWDL